ncbi:hypothetical protein DUNSADRAFT_5058 [Dunaliella salina]|uniref:RRM domain-containing protein n=1 Tax=Dunaliella salina TaxID=3046 RepID=A0ABQ7HAD8_DUNSA|nr:hypothetical protein DUNSADRAFT_5058 [Dunaliella salina]|eukprot:KAF5843820.1 hypothetical protein DUNSADRAFT_5058 [Dunaliella salina]
MTKIYVGNLPLDVRERELDDLFYKFGKIRLIDIKTPSRPPAYGFVEFDDPRDAEEAVRRRDNYDFGGYRIRVEVARGASGAGTRDGFNRPPKATPFRCLVKGLPRGASWQDLKDHMRRAAKPLYIENLCLFNWPCRITCGAQPSPCTLRTSASSIGHAGSHAARSQALVH